MRLTVKTVRCIDSKLDSGFDGNRFQCTLGIWLSDGRYQEIEVESMTNPREWEKEAQ
jgi:hypothetical protein